MLYTYIYSTYVIYLSIIHIWYYGTDIQRVYQIRKTDIRVSNASKCILKYSSQDWPTRLTRNGRIACNKEYSYGSLNYSYVRLIKIRILSRQNKDKINAYHVVLAKFHTSIYP